MPHDAIREIWEKHSWQGPDVPRYIETEDEFRAAAREVVEMTVSALSDECISGLHKNPLPDEGCDWCIRRRRILISKGLLPKERP